MKPKQHIALYVSGSIAAYKSATLARLLIKSGADVRVVMTASAQQFITPFTFEVLTKHEVLVDAFDAKTDYVPHIELADWTDLAIVAPASANLIGKLANGVADDMASLSLMATTAPKIIVPAMNEKMLTNPATQRNIKQLQADGYLLVQTEFGFLAEGYAGQGRMTEPEQIFAAIDSGFGTAEQTLVGKHVVVTAGGTREPLDPVRYIGNNSSGKMGYAVAAAAFNAGATVTLISGKTNLPAPLGAKIVNVVTTEDMDQAVQEHFTTADILIMAAAVADFKPAVYADQKIKKQTDQDGLVLNLGKTADIVKTAGEQKKPGQIIVGFAAETQNLLQNATKKLTEKRMDMMVANDVSGQGIGFNSDNNQVTFILPNHEPETTKVASKQHIAALLINRVSALKE